MMRKLRSADLATSLDPAALGVLMPMYLTLDPAGTITACGPTLTRILSAAPPLGHAFFDQFEIRRPSGIHDLPALRHIAGSRIYLQARSLPRTGLRGIALPLADGKGMLMNLSFGIGILDAVRDHGLTDADFAATDLAIELLYVVETKSAVAEELRALNLRLQGAKSVAEEQAMTDTLTGLRNRRAFDAALDQAVTVAAEVPFGLMQLDLDFFKAVNDSHGHAAGDQVLRRVARVLTAETRAWDTVARIGGDEFVILLPGLSDAARLRVIAQRIIASLARPIFHEGQACRIGASVGLALSCRMAPLSAGAILTSADQALYAAKHAGRGCSRFAPGPSPEGRPQPG